MAKYESDHELNEALRKFLASGKMHGIYLDDEDAKISVGKTIFNILKRNELVKSVRIISDLKLGFSDEAKIIDNLKMQRLILDLSTSSEVISSVVKEASELCSPMAKLKDVSETTKLMLGFCNQTVEPADVMILNEWPVVVCRKNKIDTSAVLTRYLGDCRRKLIITTNYDFFLSVALVKYQFVNGILVNHD